MRRVALVTILAALAAVAPLNAGPGAPPAGTRVKDIASLQGTGSLPLIGYGLVVGLNKTGDRRQTVFSNQTLASMLERFGVAVEGGQIKIENVAAVLVTGELPSYARTGGRLDVTASSIGDARSLQGGVLLPTALRGPDGQVRVSAQGSLSLGGFGGGTSSNSVQVNHLTVGRVPGGGLVQVAAPAAAAPADTIAFTLKDPDFMSADRVAHAISAELGEGSARAVDAATVTVTVPAQYRNAVPELVARLEPLAVEVDTIARVVINERTGTVVVGGAVRIGPAAVAHGNLSVRIATTLSVSQPGPFSKGETTVVPNEKVDVKEGTAQLATLEAGTTLDAVVRSLNALGATPRDIIAILQALKAAGALRAELVILATTAPIDGARRRAAGRLRRGFGGQVQDGERQQIAKLAHEFEAMLMTQMLREMRRSMLSDEDSEGGYGNAAMTDTIDIELGQALSRAGGFGLTASLAPRPSQAVLPGPVLAPQPQPQARPQSSSEPSAPASAVSVPGGRVTSTFGWRRDPMTGAARFHKGIDVAQPVGQNVAAAAGGRVIESGDRGGYGTTIVIDHGGGRQTRYAHLSESGVRIGDSVEPGQLIGKTGNSGRSTGPHLHFEVTQDGRPVDPNNH